ncbi:ExeA family protein [Vibrio mexicanus]|uniref:ExeA family protein n=1 Tax=Vibrio mexicanus TaxID=1004326 RepID=UPI00063CE971|nr:ExeA family protein [Vibrio mexicanus]
MYKEFFGCAELPFSIVPNSRYLFLSPRHKEAIFHLESGLGDGGGFAMLTGEVGTGKTTVAKAMLKSLDDSTQAGFILNPTFSSNELLEAICDEFRLDYAAGDSLKQLSDTIHRFLLENHSKQIQTLLVIDEAQHLSIDVLEQLRLLTNLETERTKLLKVLLVGQPELQQKLKLPQLRQLAQRITGRYHLLPLDAQETSKYIRFRLERSGASAELFSSRSIRHIATATSGIPRLINLVCDASLKHAYSVGEQIPSFKTVELSCDQVMAFQFQPNPSASKKKSGSGWLVVCAINGVLLAIPSYYYMPKLAHNTIAQVIENQHPTVEPVKVETEQLATAFTELLKKANQQDSAITDLYHLWGHQASVIDKMCDGQSTNFRCVRRLGNWQQVIEQNKPVVLTLQYQGETAYATLYQADAQYVDLLLAGKRVQIERRWIDELWVGEYYTVWQAFWNQTLREGMRGESVSVLDTKLSALLGEEPGQGLVFDRHLKNKVELFQRWQNMDVDGIAGRQTLSQLEKLSQENPPTLEPQRSQPQSSQSQEVTALNEDDV